MTKKRRRGCALFRRGLRIRRENFGGWGRLEHDDRLRDPRAGSDCLMGNRDGDVCGPRARLLGFKYQLYHVPAV